MIESEFSELERFLEVVVILDVLVVVWNEFLYTDKLEEAAKVLVQSRHPSVGNVSRHS